MDGLFFENTIFDINNDTKFNEVALQLFDFQRVNNKTYNKYLQLLGKENIAPRNLKEIPYMPVEFFKKFKVTTTNYTEATIFTSSGTTGQNTSRHYVKDINLYYKSLIKGFEDFYGPLTQYHVLALLPAYLERTGSSLVTMVEKFMEFSHNGNDGFFLYDFDSLAQKIDSLILEGKKILLIGVTFALLDYAEKFLKNYGNNVIIMETGGMKGRRKEIVREEVHEFLCNRLGVETIHSEYGMTELLSQAYSFGKGIYHETSTMRILIREATDPFRYVSNGTSGGINIVDLANIYSCSFLETKDLGIKYNDGTFKVLGRFDASDTRGCNLLYVK